LLHKHISRDNNKEIDVRTNTDHTNINRRKKLNDPIIEIVWKLTFI